MLMTRIPPGNHGYHSGFVSDNFSLSSGHRGVVSTPLIAGEAPPIMIVHADVRKAESIIRNAWADVRLVGD